MPQGLYLLAICAGLSTAIVAVCLKAAERHQCLPARVGLVQWVVAGLVSLGIAWVQNAAWADPLFWGLGICTGLLTFSAVPIMITAYRYAPPSLVWTLANMGLILPILLSAFFLKETLTLQDLWLMLCFAALLACFHLGTRPAGPVNSTHRLKSAAWLAATLLINGLLMFAFKLNGLWFAHQSPARLVAVMNGAAILPALWLILRRKGGFHFRPIEAGVGAIAGLASAASILFLLPAMTLPAITVFPLIQGISLVGGIALAAFFFSESMNRWKTAGILLGLVLIIGIVNRPP